MGASGHRFRALPFLTGLAGLALCASSACGGAESTLLDRPAAATQGDDQTSQPVPEASSSSSGGGRDATVVDDASRGMTDDAGDDAPVEDVQSSPAEAGRDAAMCAPCTFPNNQCCTVPGSFSYGQCYNALLCRGCCM